MTPQRVRLAKQKALRKRETATEEAVDQGRAARASRRARNVAAAASRFLARTGER